MSGLEDLFIGDEVWIWENGQIRNLDAGIKSWSVFGDGAENGSRDGTRLGSKFCSFRSARHLNCNFLISLT